MGTLHPHPRDPLGFGRSAAHDSRPWVSHAGSSSIPTRARVPGAREARARRGGGADVGDAPERTAVFADPGICSSSPSCSLPPRPTDPRVPREPPTATLTLTPGAVVWQTREQGWEVSHSLMIRKVLAK
jgi:hypothetical protein